MKKIQIALLSAMFVMVMFILGSCGKTNSTVCSWDYQGRHYLADSSSVSSGSDSRLLAYSGLTAIAIDGGQHLTVGAYTFHRQNTSGQPYFFYIQISSILYSQSGTLVVTASDNTKMSGNFSVTLTDASVISGSFKDVPFR
jgi:hypothetical protein